MKEAEFVKIAKALADPTRARILHEIRERGEMTCGDVCGCFPKSQPTMSHHIRALAESGVIACRKDGQFHVLSVDEVLLKTFAAKVLGGGADGGDEGSAAESDAAAGRKSAKVGTASARPRASKKRQTASNK